MKNDLFDRYKAALEILEGDTRPGKSMKDHAKYQKLLRNVGKKKENTGLEVGKLAGVLEEAEKYENLVASLGLRPL